MEMETFDVVDQATQEKKECVALIRKLTETEVFRLMGVDDKDIDTIKNSGISRSACYKLAGNSIVVDVLYHIFRKLLIEKKNESQQLTIFDALGE